MLTPNYDFLTDAYQNNSYDISITSYENNELYKIQTYENPIQIKLTEQQILKRSATRYRNENSIELTKAFDVDGTSYMHCLCLGKDLVKYNSILEEKVECSFVREKETDITRSEKAQKSLSISTSRSKKKIYEYAMSNSWQYFATFTFNDDLLVTDATNYEECSTRLAYYLNNLRKNFPNMTYLIVPEQHVENRYYQGKIVFPNDPNYPLGKYRWHFHGLMNGIDESYMQKAYYPNSTRLMIQNGKQIYTIKNYNSGNYGHSTISKIENQKAVSNYICKYITKETVEITKGKKRYWASRNLVLSNNKKKFDKTMKDEINRYFKESDDYYKEQEIKADGFQQTISYILTSNKELVDKVKNFDMEEYSIIREMAKGAYFQKVHSLNLRKTPVCMKEYIRGQVFTLVEGCFYQNLSLISKKKITAPIHHGLNVFQWKGERYIYLEYNSPLYTKLLDNTNT